MRDGRTEKPTTRERPFDVEDASAYLARKTREIALIERSLADASTLAQPATSPAQVIEHKFKLAAALRAERSLQSWAVTETARPEVQHWRFGAYQFSFGYQRADLQVRGPAIYRAIDASQRGLRQHTLYTGSGMSAIAVVVTALLRLRGNLQVIAARGCYSETRELLNSFGHLVTVAPFAFRKGPAARSAEATRMLLLDSCVGAGFDEYRDGSPEGIDLAIFDTTCFWQDSARVRLAVEWAARSRVPLVLVRSHAKLDSLGIEYGRLGSVVLVWRPDEASRWMRELVRAAEASVRLYGVAAIPAHFPPFTGTDDYRECSRARTAAIVRNTRRMARTLSAALGDARVRKFQHGLYLALVPGKDLDLKDVKAAADDLCQSLARRGLPVRHAGSFGFDFVAVEWFFDAILRRNVIRVALADLPSSLIDRVGEGIEAWWSQHRMSAVRRPAARIVETRDATAS